MPAYETDDEQIEMLKKWWGEYGKWALWIVIIGLALGFGWRYWQQQQVKHQQQASLLYEQLRGAQEKDNREAVLQITTELTQHYSRTGYAPLANLLAAKTAVTQSNWPLAAEKLQWVIDHGQNRSLMQIARLRKARILLAQKNPTAAQKTLAVVDDKVYQPAIDQIQGDIYTAMGDSAKAHQSYQAAQAGLSAVLGSEDKLLSMELTGG